MQILKYLLMMLFLLLLVQVIFAQSEWYYQNPKPTASELSSVQFVTEDTGWAAGSMATLIKTTDGGKNWKIQLIEGVEGIAGITDILFMDGQCGWIIVWRYTGGGWGGFYFMEKVLLRTIDGGDNWTQVPIFEEYDFQPSSMFFIDRYTGWLTGGYTVNEEFNSMILKTTNGGDNWVIQDSSKIFGGALFFLDENIGWTISEGSSPNQKTILKTENGGENWVSYPAGITEQLDAIFFIDENTGWTVGTDNTILKTIDGGSSWFNPYTGSNITGQNQFISVQFTDHNNGFITGWFQFLKTNDGGETYTVYEPNQKCYLSVFFIDDSIGWRVGTNGAIQKTTNAGTSWEYQSSAFETEEFVHVDFVNEYSGWVITGGKIYHTENSGWSWELQRTGSNISYESIFAVDSLNCWVVGYDKDTAHSLILKTVDAGQHWEKQQVEFNSKLNSACFINKNIGWLVGESGLILFTDNGGLNWTEQESGTTHFLTSVDFVDPDHGWAGGRNYSAVCYSSGIILTTEDGGEEWRVLVQDTVHGIQSIDFIDSLNGWVVGGNCWSIAKNDNGEDEIQSSAGYIYKTIDGGQSWKSREVNMYLLESVKFINDSEGWTAGDKLWHTIDGGEHWIEQNYIPNAGILSVDFVNSNTGWIAGYWGMIMHLTDDEISHIELPFVNKYSIPSSFSLNQNYPNPFNPSTTIEFTLPKSEFITLKVYNILGEEVSTLVDNKLQAGNHSFQFDGSSHASGIYLYRIDAGEFQDVRKMIYLK